MQLTLFSWRIHLLHCRRIYFFILVRLVLACTVLFSFSPPLFFRFFCLIFFLMQAFSRFHSGGKGFWKSLIRILELDERKARWVVEQDFHGNFQVNVTWFFAFFSGVFDWIVLILVQFVWFEISLHSAQVNGHKLSVTIRTDDVTSSRSTWTRMGGYRQLRGEWVNKSFI